jgi:hypothetical protein
MPLTAEERVSFDLYERRRDALLTLLLGRVPRVREEEFDAIFSAALIVGMDSIGDEHRMRAALETAIDTMEETGGTLPSRPDKIDAAVLAATVTNEEEAMRHLDVAHVLEKLADQISVDQPALLREAAGRFRADGRRWAWEQDQNGQSDEGGEKDEPQGGQD